MGNYVWRTTSGALDITANWIDRTTGANPAPNPPGGSDNAEFANTGGSVSGNGSVRNLNIDTNASAAWLFTGKIAAGDINAESATWLVRGAALTLSGIPSSTAGNSPYGGNINAPFLLTGAALNSSGSRLDVGATYAPQSSAGSTLSVTNASTVTALDLSVGAGASGTVNVTGAGSTLTTAASSTYTTAGALIVGVQATANTVTTAGNGVVTVANSGTVSVGNGLYVGMDSGSVGAVTVASGGDLTLAGGTAEIGDLTGSTGSMTLNNGGTFTLAAGGVIVGSQAGAAGTLTINAGGNFTVTEASQTASYLLTIGNAAAMSPQAAGTGTVTVQGAGAVLNMNDNPIAVGYAGTGTLNVLAGGTVEAGTTDSTVIASLAVGRSGSGTITVSGTGSTLSLAGSLYAGRAGTGVINVTLGGTLTDTTTASDTSTFGSGGTINNVYVNGGTGTLNVSGSATASFGTNLAFGANGSAGFLTINTGGSVQATGYISIGSGTTTTGGTGTVLVEGGGMLRSAGPHVTGSASIATGTEVGTTGTLTATGAGSVLDAGGDRISIGSRGAGTLSIKAGATALAGSTMYSDVEAGFTVGSLATGRGPQRSMVPDRACRSMGSRRSPVASPRLAAPARSR